MPPIRDPSPKKIRKKRVNVPRTMKKFREAGNITTPPSYYKQYGADYKRS